MPAQNVTFYQGIPPRKVLKDNLWLICIEVGSSWTALTLMIDAHFESLPLITYCTNCPSGWQHGAFFHSYVLRGF